jgi:hypothetical protein
MKQIQLRDRLTHVEPEFFMAVNQRNSVHDFPPRVFKRILGRQAAPA